MADNDESRGRFGSWLSNGQLLITLMTAAFSLYLNVQQNKIKEQQDQIKTNQERLAYAVANKGEIEKFVKQITSYMGEASNLQLNIPKPQQEAIIIDLLDAQALANVSQEGKTDSQKILHTPLWLALATGNVEALGLLVILSA